MMPERPRPSWLRAAVLLGLGYALIGITFAWPTTHVHTWRLAAWTVSAIVYASHLWYENARLRNSPTAAALHVALAVALGAFGLAAGANIHALTIASPGGHRSLLLLALALWPLITALPAFLLALAVSALATRLFSNGPTR